MKPKTLDVPARKRNTKPYYLTEMLLAERDAEKNKIVDGKGKRRREVEIKNVGLIESQEKFFDISELKFDYRLMYRKELVKKTGVPRSVVNKLIENGKLPALRLPGCKHSKYSPKQLESLIVNYNGLK